MSTPDPSFYPLTWPPGYPRRAEKDREEAAFKVDLARARDDLFRELRLLGAVDVVLSSNLRSRADGIPSANAPEPKDPGVALYFKRFTISGGSVPYAIACDTYTKARWNVRALGATIEGLRKMQAHGASAMMERAFTGFAALPAAPKDREHWWEVLGIARAAPEATVLEAYRKLAREHHPDRGGESARMAAINAARDAALAEVRAR